MTKTNNPNPTTTESRRPVRTLEAWPLRAAVWANVHDKDGESRTFHSVTFERRYKTDDGWRSSSSFRTEDLPKLALLAAKLFDQLVMADGEGDPNP